MICPMLCSAFRSSSVLSKVFFVSFTSSRSRRTLASSSCRSGRDGEMWRVSGMCPKKTSRDPTEGGDRARRVGRSRRRRERVDGAHLMLQHEFPILVDRRGFRVHVARHGVRLAGSFPFVSPRRLLGTCSDLREAARAGASPCLPLRRGSFPTIDGRVRWTEVGRRARSCV